MAPSTRTEVHLSCMPCPHRMDDKRVRQIHLLWRHRGSYTGPMAYSELAGMMSKALEQLEMFKSKVIKPVAARATVLPVFA